jgi:hypothetical protein
MDTATDSGTGHSTDTAEGTSALFPFVARGHAE